MLSNDRKNNFVLITLLVGGFIGTLSQSMLTSALPSIMKEFDISATLGQWLTTIYVLVLGIVTSATAYLINKYDITKLFISALLLFLGGCGISLVAPSFMVLLFSRVIQACGAAVLLPLSQVMALKIFPVEKHGMAMGLIGIVVGASPALGPTLSGLIVDSYGWRYIFVILMIAAVMVIISAMFMKTNKEEKIKGNLDALSIIFYGTGFCGLMIAITNQEIYGWVSLFTIVPFIVGFICIFIFVLRQLKLPEPLLKIKLLRNKRLAISVSLIIVTYIAMMSGTMMLPIYIQSVMGLSAAVSGAVLLPGASIIAFLSPVTGHLFDKYGFKVISLLGMTLLVIGNGAFSFFKIDSSIALVTALYAIRLTGISFLMTPLQAYGVSELEKIDLSHATAIINSFRQISGALGSAILVAIMSAASANNKVTDIRGINFSFGVETIFLIIAMIIVMFYLKTCSDNEDGVNSR